ncbi:MAG: catechol 2,3-dioxygenase-like lactoylglutathione lyase family enzyme [Rhodothermales bacterium]|jgi:catechol 2,3-dioxygenase-like lactoylglutathione lyase family enzyme
MEILDLNHVALHVADADASCHFYGEVLELPSKARPAFGFPGGWFALGPVRELHLIGGRDNAVNSASRGNHFALEVASLAESEAFLRSKGLDIQGPQTRPDGALQLYITDPDGYSIEFTELTVEST